MSKIEVDEIVKQSGSTLTLGGPGTAVTLGSGATQTGFGRTGTVDWCTTAKTSPFTAVSGDGFFVNTTSGGITVTLPSSPSQGDIVAFKDYANTWDCNAVTLCRNGSKINGVCSNTDLVTESQSVTLIYVDGTKGWQDIHDSTANISGNPGFISATGGTITTSGDFKIHTFTGDGCFAVTNTFGSGVGAKVSYMVVAGGAGGAGNAGNFDGGGGGGAGGFREGKQACAGYTASPLAATPCSGLPVSVQTYSITVGAGGTASAPASGGTGSNSIFSTITSAGGGGGARSPGTGGSGGSGGGGVNSACTAGAGNTPPVSPPQGNNGSPGVNSGSSAGGGGGGATAVAGTATLSPLKGGAGGAGATTSINATPTTFAGGGGGAGYVGGSNPAPNSGGNGGAGGGGSGGSNPPAPYTPFVGQAGTANTGGGGGAAANPGGSGGAGGSGIVIIRYKFQ